VFLVQIVVLFKSWLAGDEQIEQAHVVDEIAGADDVKRDVRGQSRVTEVERVAGPKRRPQLHHQTPQRRHQNHSHVTG